ncbi:hypothetical protein JYK21_02165, partial [Ralstonia pickettii]|nr:hypothetical protein [Ralstonia pickettii]
LLDNQYDYKGAIEIVEFLQLIHSQGFYIESTNYERKSPIQIRANYENLEERITNYKNHEGIRKILIFLSDKIDQYYSGISNIHGIPWYEYDSILLELEDIFFTYQEDWEIVFTERNILDTAISYLNDYLSGGTKNQFSTAENIKILQGELRDFYKDNQKSIFWPIISMVLNEYESDNWQVNRTFISEEALYLFSDAAKNQEFDYITIVENWSLSGNPWRDYSIYKNLEKSDEISEMKSDPIEMLSIYLYSFSIDKDLYNELYIGDKKRQDIDWTEVIVVPSILIGNTMDKTTIEYTFLNLVYEPVVKVRMINDGDSWKVAEQELMNN